MSGATACFVSGRDNKEGIGAAVSKNQDERREKACGPRISREGYKGLLPDVNDGLGGTAGLWNFLRISDEEILQAAPEIEQRSRENGANSLKNKES